MKIEITTGGMSTLIGGLAGKPIKFTKIQIGNGASQEPGNVTRLNNPLMDLPILEITTQDQYASLKTVIDNASVDSAFSVTELGVWAESQSDPGQTVLYAYGSASDAEADRVTPIGEGVVQSELEIMAFVSGAKDISAVISSSMVFASAKDLQDHKGDRQNPHHVTAEQVGLGNVPNVATNDQQPTYTTAKKPANLTSGEKLHIAMGKIAAAVTALINHLGNQNNPHNVTAAQAGAAAASHDHSAVDIKRGVLGTARGGTGKGDWQEYRLVYADSSSSLSQLPAPSSAGQGLMGGPGRSPYWGSIATADDLEAQKERVDLLYRQKLTDGNNYFVLRSWDHGRSLPSPGVPGRIFFKEV